MKIEEMARSRRENFLDFLSHLADAWNVLHLLQQEMNPDDELYRVLECKLVDLEILFDDLTKLRDFIFQSEDFK